MCMTLQHDLILPIGYIPIVATIVNLFRNSSVIISAEYAWLSSTWKQIEVDHLDLAYKVSCKTKLGIVVYDVGKSLENP